MRSSLHSVESWLCPQRAVWLWAVTAPLSHFQGDELGDRAWVGKAMCEASSQRACGRAPGGQQASSVVASSLFVC